MRFVVLHHRLPAASARADHYDFMLEMGGVLWTWALAERPDGAAAQSAARLADHRLRYLDYEGPLSDGRGEVARYDTGPCALLRQDAEAIVVELQGARLRCRVLLTRRDESSTLWDYRCEPFSA